MKPNLSIAHCKKVFPELKVSWIRFWAKKYL
jgi:hypothetical protein